MAGTTPALVSCGSEEGQKRRWTNIFLTGLIVLLLGLLSCARLFAYLITEQSAVTDDITVDTLSALYVPKTSAPRVTQPTAASSPLPKNISTTMPPEERHLVPPSHLQGDECVGPLCRNLANSLRTQLDSSADPCYDFYKYVCGKYRRYSTFRDVQDAVRVGIRASFKSLAVVPSNQTAIQKAAAMYQACINFASSYLPETIELVRWMIDMNLDFQNTTRLETVDPVEVMVRGSLELGVEAIISIRFHERILTGFRRLVTATGVSVKNLKDTFHNTLFPFTWNPYVSQAYWPESAKQCVGLFVPVVMLDGPDYSSCAALRGE
ncbi:uncharacterized protein LOC142802906 [Rhipicephalus microplus]|uniref:uncharacterized protein LOC142802906 n=1 Tax=Rhipicephalus microplus TaxID=6941 RepID=UPI003F6CE4FD